MGPSGKVTTPEAYQLFDTAFGVCGIAWSARGVRWLQLPEANRTATERRIKARGCHVDTVAPPSIKRLMADVQEYFAGSRVDFSRVVLDLTGISPFHGSIYATARRLGWGETASYGELAEQVGSPGAARAVGQAMGRNPVPIIIPCHRVLAAGRKMGGFSAFGGTSTKLRLLALEGVQLRERRREPDPLLPGLLPASQHR
jgi:methylated-DNA-[protein]-cysteine S-methyltransferase